MEQEILVGSTRERKHDIGKQYGFLQPETLFVARDYDITRLDVCADHLSLPCQDGHPDFLY